MAASVVDLPEPVGPVTSTRPRGFSDNSANTGGQESWASVWILDGMVRNTAPAPRFWWKALTRKRARPCTSKLKSHSSMSSYCLRWLSFMMSYTMACTCLCVSGSTLMRRTSPCTRIMGGRPDDKCRSEALFLTEKASSWVMSMGARALRKCRAGGLCSGHHGQYRREHTTSAPAHRPGLCRSTTARGGNHLAGRQQDLSWPRRRFATPMPPVRWTLARTTCRRPWPRSTPWPTCVLSAVLAPDRAAAGQQDPAGWPSSSTGCIRWIACALPSA